MPIDPREWAARAFDRADERYEKQIEVAIASSLAAIESAFLLNGGAVIALLAFLAAVIGSDRDQPELHALTERILSALYAFAYGAAAAVLASGIAYLVNRAYAEAIAAETKAWDHPYLLPTPASRRHQWWTQLLHVIAVIAVFASVVLFFVGLAKIQALI